MKQTSIPQISVLLRGRPLPEGMSPCIVGFCVGPRSPDERHVQRVDKGPRAWYNGFPVGGSSGPALSKPEETRTMIKSHFFLVHPPRHLDLPRADQAKIARVNREALLLHGYNDLRSKFPFCYGNESSKQAAQVDAVRYAQHWADVTGIEMQVSEGASI